MTDCLTVSGLTVRYGGVQALGAVDARVEGGSLTGLIGPNGAGKTTFVDAVTGFAPASGSILFEGRDITRLSAHRRARLGMARTWQAAELFEDLTVRENLEVTTEASRPWWSFIPDSVLPGRSRAAAVAHSLELLDIGELGPRLPRELSFGQRKMVGIARALAARPRLLLLDEPAAGLDEAESEVLGGQLRRVLAEGVSILLIDHDVSLVSAVCDQLYVLDRGANLVHGPTAEVLADPRVVEAYLGAAGAAADAGARSAE